MWDTSLDKYCSLSNIKQSNVNPKRKPIGIKMQLGAMLEIFPVIPAAKLVPNMLLFSALDTPV